MPGKPGVTLVYPGFQNQGSSSIMLTASLEDFLLNAAFRSPGYREGSMQKRSVRKVSGMESHPLEKGLDP